VMTRVKIPQVVGAEMDRGRRNVVVERKSKILINYKQKRKEGRKYYDV
jgi:hypothetical protein